MHPLLRQEREILPAGPESPGQARRKRRRRGTAALGLFVLILGALFAVAALAALTTGAVRFAQDFFGPSETPAYFQSYLKPVVMFDPKPFSGLAQAGADWKLETGIWAALEAGEPSGQYAVSPDGREILPVRDVAANLKKYFGIVSPSYHTFTAHTFTYEYDAKNACYYIPLTQVNTYFLPRVKKIARSFKTVTLTVEYVQGTDWGQGQESLSGPAEKTVEIVLTGGGGGYRLRALRAAPAAQASSRK